MIAEALIRSARTFVFIFVITLALEVIMHAAGEDKLGDVFADLPVLGEIISAAVGLIPNCAASILVSQLYLDGVIGAGAMMSGLTASAGIGMLVLFEENKNQKENVFILALLYVTSVAWGIIIEAAGLTF